VRSRCEETSEKIRQAHVKHWPPQMIVMAPPSPVPRHVGEQSGNLHQTPHRPSHRQACVITCGLPSLNHSPTHHNCIPNKHPVAAATVTISVDAQITTLGMRSRSHFVRWAPPNDRR
jgi:hypothetical protein